MAPRDTGWIGTASVSRGRGTGDGRPSRLDAKYAGGIDVYITETQTQLVSISSGVQGVPPFIGRYTVDTHHTPAYAAGYLMNEVQPRLGMVTHMAFDAYQNEETVAEIRQHWDGPFNFGAPDGVVVNVTKDAIWVREGTLPDYPNSRAPQQDFDSGELVVPYPRRKREEIQEPFVREQQIDAADYYPEGYYPNLLEHWPVDDDLVINVEHLPPATLANMGQNWRDRKVYDEYIANKENGSDDETE